MIVSFHFWRETHYNELPGVRTFRPSYRKNDTDAPTLYFQRGLDAGQVPSRMKNWDKRPSKMIPLNGLIASAQRRLEVLRFLPLPNLLEPARGLQFTKFHAEKSFVAQVMPHFPPGVSACPKELMKRSDEWIPQRRVCSLFSDGCNEIVTLAEVVNRVRTVF